MPEELFGRRAVLKIGVRGGAGIEIDSRGTGDHNGLRIAWHAVKTVGSEPNAATIQVWNLGEGVRTFLVEERDDLMLDAGYEDRVGAVVVGQIERVEHRREGADIVTTLEVGDGADPLRDERISIQFPRGTAVTRIVRELLGRLAIVEGDVDGYLAAIVARAATAGLPVALRRPLAIAGPIAAAVDKLARAYRFDWSIQDGHVQILPRDAAVSAEALLLTTGTGLTGEPEEMHDVINDGDASFTEVEWITKKRARPNAPRRATRTGGGVHDVVAAVLQEVGTATRPLAIPRRQEAVETPWITEGLGTELREGIRFTALLQAALRPGLAVGIRTARLRGVYRLDRVEMDADTRGGPWQAACEARALLDVPVPGL